MNRRLIANEWNEKSDCNVFYSVTGKVMKYSEGGTCFVDLLGRDVIEY